MSPEQAEGRSRPARPAIGRLQPGRDALLPADGSAALRGDAADVIHAVQRGDFRRRASSTRDRPGAGGDLSQGHGPPDRRPVRLRRALADDLDRWMADEPVMACADPWTRRPEVADAAPHGRDGRRRGAARRPCRVRRGRDRAGPGQRRPQKAKRPAREANGQVTRANADLSAAKAQLEDRFHLAMDAVRTFHTGVSADVLLTQREFDALRKKLLEARGGSIASWKRYSRVRPTATRGFR